jgi:hypothetical protein
MRSHASTAERERWIALVVLCAGFLIDPQAERIEADRIVSLNVIGELCPGLRWRVAEPRAEVVHDAVGRRARTGLVSPHASHVWGRS